MSFYDRQDDTTDDAAEDLGGSPDGVENEYGSREAGEPFEDIASIVGRLVERLTVDD